MDQVNEHGENLDKDTTIGTSDDDELSDGSVSVDNEDTSDYEMPGDDEPSNESASVDGEGNINDEIMSQIERNDPSITYLRIDDDFYPPDGDWGDLGRAIGRNTHLKKLWVTPRRSRDNNNGLFRGLISNRSIQKLTLGGYIRSTSIDDEGANIVAGLIHNAPIKELTINCADNITNVGWLAIFTALQTNPTCRLEQLILSSNNMNEAAAVSLSNVLLRHSATLETLDLGWRIQNMTIADWLAFLQPLQDPICRLKKLILNSNAITDEVAAVLTNALANISRLRELDLGFNRDVTATGWVEFSTVLRNPNSALEILDLGGNRINDHVMTSFALQDPRCRLKKLILRYSAITDEVAAVLTNALANDSRLRELDLSCNRDVTATGWAVLRNPNSALEKLDLRGNRINDHVMTSFADALANNNMLRELNLDLENVSYDGYAAFINILCNNASILSTYHSNHSLEKLCHTDDESSLPENPLSLLRINREDSHSQAVRIKIIKIHFSGSNINTQIFARLEVNVLPTVIAWMGRDGGSDGIGDLLFAFLRSMPLLSDTKSVSKKRKIAG